MYSEEEGMSWHFREKSSRGRAATSIQSSSMKELISLLQWTCPWFMLTKKPGIELHLLHVQTFCLPLYRIQGLVAESFDVKKKRQVWKRERVYSAICEHVLLRVGRWEVKWREKSSLETIHPSFYSLPLSARRSLCLNHTSPSVCQGVCV